MGLIGTNCLDHHFQSSLNLLLYKLIIFQCKKNTELSVERVHSAVERCQTSVLLLCFILSFSYFPLFFFHKKHCVNFIFSFTFHHYNNNNNKNKKQGISRIIGSDLDTTQLRA